MAAMDYFGIRFQDPEIKEISLEINILLDPKATTERALLKKYDGATLRFCMDYLQDEEIKWDKLPSEKDIGKNYSKKTVEFYQDLLKAKDKTKSQ